MQLKDAGGPVRRPWFNKTEKILDEVRAYDHWKSDQAMKCRELVVEIQKAIASVPVEFQACRIWCTVPDKL